MELNDPARLDAVAASGLLDRDHTEALDNLAEMARFALSVPTALVSAVLDDRQVLAGVAGAVPDEVRATRTIPLDLSYCRFVVEDEQPAVVADFVEDGRAPHLAELGASAYCGVPILDDDGAVLGSVCAIDTDRRDWTDGEVRRLEQMVPILRDQIRFFRRQQAERRTLDEAQGERARMGNLLAQSSRELDAARATVDEFLAVAAHDLRSPMATAAMVVETMRRTDREIPVESLLDTLDRTVSRAIRLLDRLHEHARAGVVAFSPRPVDLNVIVRDVLDDLSAALSSRDVRVHHEALMPMAMGDDVLLRQLVANLLGNAVRYAADEDGAEIWIEATVTDDGVLLTIADDGPGIDPEIAADIFRAGVQSARGAEGIGLGLATCRTIVDRHGGRIWIDRAEQGGAQVNVVLEALPQRDRRVLVLDDDPDMRLLYTMTLARLDDGRLQHRSAADLAEAAAVLRELPLSQGDLAIIDLHLPDGDPVELIERLVAASVQVHSVSGLSPHDDLARRAADAGAHVTSKSAILEEGLSGFAERVLGSW